MVTDCTIVIASYNRRDQLDATLRRIDAFPDGPPVVVVDDGSTDGTAAMLRERWPGIRAIALQRNVGAFARNAGVLAARTRYVAFCDDDCWWEPDSIARAVALLDAHPEVALLNARVVVRADERVDEACTAMAVSPLPKRSACPGRAIATFMAGAAIVRREAFLAAGGYHERYHIGAEEPLVALELLDRGWEMVYVDNLVLHHHPYAAGRVPARRRRRVLRNRLWTAWLRRSLRGAWRSTLALLRQGCSDPVARAALADALRGLPWVLRERRPVARRVEALLDSLPRPPI
ncbi:MAG TPA: glycosyltransferase family 2 protein [Candidatus Elarobacter sp.]|nr:glycosyltransferase family 2 protein [Candidatus Elarobacter sp.]